MPYQATFSGNFEKLDKAVHDANQKMEVFEVSVKGVQRQLQTMVSSLDGSKLVREATLMVAAVEKIGGATKLNEAETKRYNATISDAVAKMNALGQEAPEAWKKIAAETEKAAKAAEGVEAGNKKAGESMLSLEGIAKKAAGAIAATFTIGAVVDFGKQLLAVGGQINDIANRTKIGVVAVQELGYAAKSTGSSFEAVEKASSKLSDKLVEESDATVAGLRDVGLSIQNIRAMKPEDAFTAVADAIGQIQDPMRQTQLAIELFGQTGVELLPAMRSGFANLREEAHQTGQVMSGEAVQALADFADKWEAVDTQIKATAATSITDIVTGIGNAASRASELAETIASIVVPGPVQALLSGERGQQAARGAVTGAALGLATGFGVRGLLDPVLGMQEQAQAQRDLDRSFADVKAPEAFKKTEEAQKGLTSAMREFRGVSVDTLAEWRKQDEAARRYAEQIKALSDKLTGADISREIKNLEAAWKSLTPTQKANEESIKRLVTAYADLRQKAKLDGLPTTLEEVHRAFLPVIEGTKDWAAITGSLASGPLPELSRQTERVRNMMMGFRADGLLPVTKSFADLSATTMIPWPVDGIKNAGAHITATKEKTADLNTSLHDLAGAWAQLAQVRPLEGWIQDVAELIQLMNIGQQVGADFSKAFTKQVTDSMGNVSTKFDFSSLTGSQGAGNAIAGWASAAQFGISSVSAVSQATDVAGRGNRALRGAATGASIGANPALIAATGGWSVVVGAVAGAIVGALRNPGFEQEMKRIANEFGVNIGEKLAREIDKLKKQFGGDRQAAEIFAIDKIIADAGGLSDQNIGKMTGKLRDVFSMVETGKFAVADARNVLDRSFNLFVTHFQKGNEIASQSFQDIIRLNKEMGVNSEAVAAFVNSQTQALGGSIANLAAPLVEKYGGLAESIDAARKEVEKLAASGGAGSEEHARAVENLNVLLTLQKEAAASSADEFERLGVIALGAFNAAVNAGADWLTAVENMGPALDTLIGLQKDLGIESQNAGLSELVRFRDLVNNNQALVLSTQALGETMKALSSIGGITVETLAAMEAQGVTAFDRLIAAGFSENQALRQMKDFLLNVKSAHEQLGTPIDENTQKLIDMADAQGILKDDGKDMSKILTQGFKDMKDGTDKLVGSIGLMVRALGADVPDAVQDAIDALSKIPTNIDINARVIYDDPGAPGGPSSGDGGDGLPGAAGGIYATGGRGVATWFGEGGAPELGGPVDFMGDVLSHALNRLGGGRSGAGGSRQEINVYIGEEVVARAAARGMPSVLDVYGATR